MRLAAYRREDDVLRPWSSAEAKPLAIVVGYGPAGRMAADQLTARGFAVGVVERNLDTVETQLGLDRRITYGASADPAVLGRAGLAHAHAVVVTCSHEGDAEAICRAVRAARPDVFLAVRTLHCGAGLRCREAGADEVVVDEMVSAEVLRDAIARRITPPGRASA